MMHIPVAYWFLVISFVLSFILGWGLIPRVLVISHKHKLFDMPDDRKVHDMPIPRLGGLTFFPVIVITISLLMGIRYLNGWSIINVSSREVFVEFMLLLSGSCTLYVVGVGDDLVGVSYRQKFVAQIICGGMLAISGLWLHSLGNFLGISNIPMWLGTLITIFITVYITNAFNLIDGIDGLASGLTAIALGVFAIIFILEQQLIYAMIACSTLGVIVPFWFYNVFGNRKKGKKIFMGDTGSLTLGFIMSFLLLRIILTSYQQNGTPGFILVAISALLIPSFDVVRVAVHRMRKHRNPFKPDRNHIHHKLLRCGMRMQNVLITIISLDIFYIILNYLLRRCLNITVILLLDGILWCILHMILNKQIKKIEGTPHSV